MNEFRTGDPGLAAALRALAEADAEEGASHAVQSRLLSEVRALRRTRRRSMVKTVAIAAGLFIASAAPVWQLATRPAPDPSSAASQNADVSAGGEVATAFFPLVYSTVPMTGGRIVRLEVPRAALTAAALEPIESAGGPVSEIVLADVVVGEDGLARAVRFVRPLTREEQQERQP